MSQGCGDLPIQYLGSADGAPPWALEVRRETNDLRGLAPKFLPEPQAQGPAGATERVVCRPLPSCELCVTGLWPDRYRHREELLRNSYCNLTLPRPFSL